MSAPRPAPRSGADPLAAPSAAEGGARPPAPSAAPVFETFGCRLNAYETEAMKKLAAEAGLHDAVVVNTCAVTAEAVRQARQRIRKLRRENPGARIVVTGCAAQTEPQTFASMPEVDLVLGNAEKMAPAAWSRLSAPDFAPPEEKILVEDIMSVTETAGHLIDGFGTRARAYVQIQNGCDHRCTFCIIPYGRGNSRSAPAGQVVEQIRRLVDQGYNEVVLTGVDMTGWGADLPGRPLLGELVQRILRLVPDLPRLRISSIDSVEADPALIEAAASEPRFMPHLHLSLQAGDDMILKRMKRRHLREDAIRFCQTLRRARPDIVFGADLIAGFPTETEAMFENSLRLVDECGLTWLHVFPFSPRKGTPAARMPQLPRAVVKERAARLRAKGEAARDAWLAAQVGRAHRALVESPRIGRGESFAEILFPEDRPVGAVVEARIVGVRDGRLLAA
ncbi:tRNA (N(6)-L-threonylcarbamoyladenosine(37)-C(2))-methylthiotransferase MtaB [Oceanicella actignis]|uniref:Threonylcarbamoyladenosine tRNA methylthiotransferase MtaB n=1 Tax=Oceanicella actignis TaxID=1189325 RepID=A0A1M7S2B0_9RHOB|nr:tRNA (N(6)-L-threonylcarbamoyladenosine(37)-C(2))-methylthiotransferase MtaB [Oceanicella actignis]TYO90174.1 threonylcarbamoyladenosine tRNA methylthiotransferase MtaB [Oceanicella actignis]SES90392.1 threonylcarbamoyladenosine tRNA methylthiotransferase MtaB [Oceanicella actignis]SHN52653.1 threonylcarbamoyladenosine tRNA methylthiotransferase MtaB [Oceanicella actignis]